MDNGCKTNIANTLNNKNKVFSAIDICHDSNNKQKVESKKRIACEVFKHYVTNTTLHGIKYLGPETSTLAKKMCWIVGCIISILCCSYLICNIWIKWNTSPVIISFNQEQTPIWEIPFPAVTICPTDKVRFTRYNYTKNFGLRNELKDEFAKKFWDVSLICDLEIRDEIFDKTKVMNFSDESVIANIKSVTYRNSEAFIYNVKWLNAKINNDNVTKFFANQLTEEGICYTFNSLSVTDMYTDKISSTMEYINQDTDNVGWTIENGYPKSASVDDYPRRTTDDGFISGLTLSLITRLQDRDFICGPPYLGFKIILHNPAEPARPGQQYILASADQEHTIIVKPEMTTTEPTLVSLHPHTRKCFFSHEKSLKYFKIYTFNNCRIECLANITLHSCGCVSFYHPRETQTKICGFGKLDCVTGIKRKLLKYKVMKEIPTDPNDKLEADIYSKCNCLPSCTSLSFSAETSQSKLHSLDKIRAMDIFNNNYTTDFKTEPINYSIYDEIQVAQIDIFFKESQFLALHRSELFGSADFFANIGGLLGLFMGFSVLSLLEFFYYFSIHLWCRIKQVQNN